jgi:hypothetical protein
MIYAGCLKGYYALMKDFKTKLMKFVMHLNSKEMMRVNFII